MASNTDISSGMISGLVAIGVSISNCTRMLWILNPSSGSLLVIECLVFLSLPLSAGIHHFKLEISALTGPKVVVVVKMRMQKRLRLDLTMLELDLYAILFEVHILESVWVSLCQHDPHLVEGLADLNLGTWRSPRLD